MTLLNVQFVVTVFTIYLLTRMSPYFSIPKLWLQGLEFCLPPTEDGSSRKSTSVTTTTASTPIEGGSKRKGGSAAAAAKKPMEIRTTSHEVVIRAAKIKSGYLNDHVFYPEFESLVIVFVCIIVSVMFSELSQCLLPAQWGADAAKSDVSFYTILFASGYATKVLTSMVMQAGGESYEMKLSVAIGLLGTVACYVLLDYSDAFLDFRVNSGFAEFREVFGRFLKARVEGESLLNVTISHEEVSTAITWLKTIFALVGGLLAALSFLPAFRIARCHHLLLMSKEQRFNSVLSTLSFVLPVFVIVFWIKPLARDVIVTPGAAATDILAGIVTDEAFDAFRFWLLLGVCALRLYLVRPYLQAYLYTAVSAAELILERNQRDMWVQVQRKILGIYAYVCVCATQLVAPTFLLLFFSLALKAKGGLSFGWCKVIGEYGSALVALTSLGSSWLAPVAESASAAATATAAATTTTQQPVLMIATILTPEFVRAVFSFLSWWFITSWFSLSVVGIIYERSTQVLVE